MGPPLAMVRKSANTGTKEGSIKPKLYPAVDIVEHKNVTRIDATEDKVMFVFMTTLFELSKRVLLKKLQAVVTLLAGSTELLAVTGTERNTKVV
jgi:hypothetical protein